MIPRIYTPSELAENTHVELEKSTSAHLQKVLRMKKGETLVAFNGDGDDYFSKIMSVGKTLTICVEERRENKCESPLHITLVQGISRGDRMDFAIQKSVELGVSAIQPLITEKSSVRINADRVDKKVRHWQSVVNSACEQSGRSIVPAVNTPVTLSDWLLKSTDPFLLLAPGASKSIAALDKLASFTVAVGPESGFSETEVNAMTSAGATLVSLGPRVLRTETAAAAAISALQTLYGDFR